MPNAAPSPAPLSEILSDATSMLTSCRQNISSSPQACRPSNQEILEQYKDFALSPLDVIKIRQGMIDGALCDECAGLPCKKSRLQCTRMVVTPCLDGVQVGFAPCRFATQKRQQSQFDQNFTTAQIPSIYHGKTFGDYAVDENNKAAVGWAKYAVDKCDGLYLYGEAGCGKTFLAAIIAQELIRQGKTVIFGDVPSLLEDLKATFDGNSHLEELMENLAAADMLILDDLGTEYPTEWAVSRLYLIINQRYNAGKPVIVTSNFTLSDVADRLNRPKNAPIGVHGTRIASRFKQMCRITTIGGGDRRRR